MTTRMELWESYRKDISENIELENAVHMSNKKLNTLFTRLSKIEPTYNKSFFKKNSQVKFDIQSVSDIELTSCENAIGIIDIINEKEQEYTYSLSYIDDLDFSSKELDDTIHSLKEGKYNKLRYVGNTNENNISIKTKIINLGGANMKLNIAIDGPSGSGKSSAAKAIAAKYNMKYVNTGLVYRAIALNVINEELDLDNQREIVESLEESMIELRPNEVVFLKGVNVTKEVRRDDVSQAASKCAAISEVRSYALKIMQTTAEQKGVIMDGRDTTFKVLPNAELKFFIDTTADVRANRRVEQNNKLGLDTNYESVLKEIEERDHRDKTRELDPLQIVDDAILIDSSEMNLDQVIEEISNKIDSFLKEVSDE